LKRRRSLTHVGGEVETAGNREVATALASALDVAPAAEPDAPAGETHPEEVDRAHVHGFHTYPARMHPSTAARLVQAVSASEATVLDPFCGSGTVLVETLIAGRAAVGTDLNPLAVRLARLKTTPHDARACEALVSAARQVAEFAAGRRERRAGSTRRYPPEDVAAFDPHVLLELDSLRAGIESLPPALQPELELVLSAILVKVSRRTSDTSAAPAQRRIAAGFPTRIFVRKTEELAARFAALLALLPEGTREQTRARVELDDACSLRTVGASTVDAVVTSPPYVATYDYLAHHALRMRWLGLDTRELAAHELGARRRYAQLSPGEAAAEWARELGRALRAMSRVCRTGARVALLIADSAVRGQPLRADEVLARIAPDAGFAFVARASQRRPHFHDPTARAFERHPRAEHAIVLQKAERGGPRGGRVVRP
jgi:SAM-dependent methyltransferase